MAADLGLVTDTAEGDADELATRRPRDALGQRGLADARRADEAEDRAFDLFDQGLDGQILDDALLGLLEPVVVFVEDRLGVDDLELVAGLVLPGQREHGVDVVADDRGLRRHRAHHLELAQLLLEALGRLFGHLLAANLVFELLELVLELVLRTELLLNRLHLLVEVVLLLVLLHLLLDASPDLLLHLENLDLVLHQLIEGLQTGPDVLGLEQVLLGGELEVDVRGDRVGQARGVVDALDADRELGRDALVELDVVLEGRLDRAHERLELGLLLGVDLGRLDDLGFDLEELGRVEVVGDPRAGLALDEDLDRAVGQAQELDDGADRSEVVNALGLGVVDLGLLLGTEQDLSVRRHRLFEGVDGLFAPDEERHDLVGEHDQLAQREERDLDVCHDDPALSRPQASTGGRGGQTSRMSKYGRI